MAGTLGRQRSLPGRALLPAGMHRPRWGAALCCGSPVRRQMVFSSRSSQTWWGNLRVGRAGRGHSLNVRHSAPELMHAALSPTPPSGKAGSRCPEQEDPVLNQCPQPLIFNAGIAPKAQHNLLPPASGQVTPELAKDEKPCLPLLPCKTQGCLV